MCIAVIVVDVEILNSLKLVPMKSKEIRNLENGNVKQQWYPQNNDENIFLDLWDIGTKLRSERDCLSLLILMNGIALLLNMQYIPRIGPLVVAMKNTISHPDVCVFLVLYLLFMLVFAVTYNISFGKEFQYYSTVGESFMSLFNVPFAEQYDNVLFSNIGDSEGETDLIRLFYSLF